MAVVGKMFRICNVVGQYRHILFNRSVPALYQQNVGIKQSIEDKLGLPPKPKKPLTPYFRFMAQIRPNLLHKNPHTKPTDIIKLVAQEWEKTDMTLRQKLEAEYKREMVDFVSANVKYEQSLTNEQREEIKKAKVVIAHSKEKRKLKKKMKELGKPKRPASAFLLFLSEKKGSRGIKSFREWLQDMGKEWENMSDEQKSHYTAQSKKGLDGYKREMQIWEEKMIRLGHIDVVRNEALIEPRTSPVKRIRRSKKSEE